MLRTNAEDKILRRRINELEQEMKRLKKGVGRLRKRKNKAEETEIELHELLDLEKKIETLQVKTVKEDRENKNPCKQCKSINTKQIAAGIRAVIVCEDCGARHTIMAS